MARESLKSKQQRAIEVAKRMDLHYGDAPCALDYGGDPFRLLIAVALSAQTTDKAVNKVTPALWAKYPDIPSMAAARASDIEEIIRSIGFYKRKSINCVQAAQVVLSEFGGEVPQTIEELTRIPGVGRKSANVIMHVVFHKADGIAVDTHVFRIAHKLKFSHAKTADQTEQDLLKVFPRETWVNVNSQWVLFGRETCIARRPKCESCFLNDICPSSI